MRRKYKKVYGVGINDADYIVQIKETVSYIDGNQKQKQIWVCPFYKTWMSMLVRCYSNKFHLKNSTYRGCSVSEEWLTFSNFKKWMEQQDWEDKQLDKDLLLFDNKVYSAETCVFIDQTVNKFVTDCRASRGLYIIGCHWNKCCKKYQAQCQNPFTKKQEYLGLFDAELEAHMAWKKRKHELACELANLQTDPRIAGALRVRYV